jgi:hypothetical protein
MTSTDTDAGANTREEILSQPSLLETILRGTGRKQGIRASNFGGKPSISSSAAGQVTTFPLLLPQAGPRSQGAALAPYLLRSCSSSQTLSGMKPWSTSPFWFPAPVTPPKLFEPRYTWTAKGKFPH